MATNIVTRGASLLRAALLVTTAIVPFAISEASARVGVTSGADGDPLGKPPDEAERVLRIGIDVQANEIITTGAKDRAHLVFLDGSALTVGSDARLVIDNFVYDPNTKKGELAINASKGVFRLVGGRISKSNAITITTPSSTIGIRGGITIFAVTQVQTVSDFVFGNSMTVTAGGKTETVTRAGSQVITNAGGAPGAATLMKKGSLNAALGQLEGGSSSSNSSSNAADQSAQNSGFSQGNSGQSTSTTNVNPSYPPNPNNNTLTNAVNNTTTSNQQNDTTPSTKTTATATTTPNPPGPNPPAPTPPGPTPSGGTTPVGPTPPAPIVIVTQGRFLQDKPYLERTFNPHTLHALPNPDNNQTLQPTGTVLNQVATITIQNGSSLQVPWLPGQAFNFNGVTPSGPAAGVGLVSADGSFFAYQFTPTDGRKFVLFGGTPTATANFPKVGIGAQQLVNLTHPGDLPFAPKSVGGDSQLTAAGNANVSPLYTIYTPNVGSVPAGQGAPTGLQVTVSIAGTGAAQKSYMGVFIANYGTDYATNSIDSSGTYAASYRLGGDRQIGRATSSQATADTGQGNAIYGDTGQYMVYTPGKIETSNRRQTTTRESQATLNQPSASSPGSSYYPVTVAAPAEAAAISPTIGQTRTSQTQTGYVAGLIDSTSHGRTSTYVPPALLSRPTDISITTDAATNRAMGTIVLRGFDGTLFGPTARLQLGGTTGRPDATSAFIDDNTYAMVTTKDPARQSTIQNGHHSQRITDNTVLASYKSAPVPLQGVGQCVCEYLSFGWWSTSIDSGRGQNDRVNMGSYVVGTLTTAVQMPQTGSATYVGGMVGNVNNRGNSYIAAGSYQMDWNFRYRAGSLNASFDGTNYRGGAAAIPGSGGTNFAGGFTGGRGRVGTLNGSFFASPGDAAKYQAGAFSIGNNSSSYKASGVFAGQR
jgi:hypothetical protein